jgi:hypothetical protein
MRGENMIFRWGGAEDYFSHRGQYTESPIHSVKMYSCALCMCKYVCICDY